MKKRLICLFIIALLALVSAGCAAPREGNVELNPIEGAVSTDTQKITLYFGNSDYSMLVGEAREIDFPVNETREYTVLKTLIGGPTMQSSGFNRIINPDTEIVSVVESGDVLFITFSKEFLDWDFFSASGASISNAKKQLAVYSVANTLIELSGYPRIQLLVDRDNSGEGQRIKLTEVGLKGTGVLEPLERNGAIVLTPKNTAKAIFDGMSSKNYAGVYDYIAYTDENGQIKPEEGSFLSAAQEKAPAIEEFQINDVIVGADGTSAVVMADYTQRSQSGEQAVLTNIPITLVRENDLWKIRYQIFEKVFL